MRSPNLCPLKIALFLGLAVSSLAREERRFTFTIHPGESQLTLKVGRAGLFKVFGHDHLIEVRRFGGEVNWRPDSPESSSVSLSIESASLRVADSDVKEETRAEIQAVMEAEVLEIEKYPTIRFESKALEVQRAEEGEIRIIVSGDLTLHGVTRPMKIPLWLLVSEERLRVRGELKFKGSHFGIEPVSVAGGTIKTKDELELSFDLVATAGR